MYFLGVLAKLGVTNRERGIEPLYFPSYIPDLKPLDFTAIYVIHRIVDLLSGVIKGRSLKDACRSGKT
jgi:hypothetical protein